MSAKQTTSDLDLHLIDECPTNPRQYFDEQKLFELAQDIGVHGVQQAIKVRPSHATKGRYDLIIGARRLRASRMVDASTIPAVVEDMDDQKMLEVQMAENLHRADMHPLEEADGYRRLHEEFGEPVDVIAEKCGKSPATIARRLRLCELGDEGRKAFLHGNISTAVAELLARIPGALQAEALKQVQYSNAEQARHMIESKFMLRLVDAPFDRSDAMLLESAGSCTDCPKRTGNDRDLFDDVKGPDVCTDPTCYERKVDVWWDRTAASAEADGKRVMPPGQAGKIIQYGRLLSTTGFVELDATCYDDPKQRSYRQLLGQKAPVVLARAGAKVFELLPRDEVVDLLKQSGASFSKALVKKEKAEQREDAQAKRERERGRQRRELIGLSIAAVVQCAEVATDKELVLEVWRSVLASMVKHSWHEVVVDVVKRRGIVVEKKQRPEDALETFVQAMDLTQLRGLAVELVATKFAYNSGGMTTTLDEFCTLFKVNPKALKELAEQQAEAAAQ